MFDDFVDGFNLAISLWIFWCGKVLLDVELFTKICKSSIVELFFIVDDDGVRYSKQAYDELPENVSCLLLGDFGEWFSLGPLDEIIRCYDGKCYPHFSMGIGLIRSTPYFAKGHGENTELSSCGDFLMKGTRC